MVILIHLLGEHYHNSLVQCSPFITVCLENIGMDCVTCISESCYKGTNITILHLFSAHYTMQSLYNATFGEHRNGLCYK